MSTNELTEIRALLRECITLLRQQQASWRMGKLAYSVDEAADECGVSASHLSDAIAEGRLKAKATKIRSDGKVAKRLILHSELEKFLANLEDA